jgi:hypothetical protein
VPIGYTLMGSIQLVKSDNNGYYGVEPY